MIQIQSGKLRVKGFNARGLQIHPGRDRVYAMKDAELLAEAVKAKHDINPLNGDELAKSVLTVMQLEPGLIAKLKEVRK